LGLYKDVFMEIIPGVHQIEGVTGSNVVLIVDSEMTLVDTGIAGNGEAIVSYIESIGKKPSDLKRILLTHFHYDHSGSAQELHEATGARIVTHRAETEVSMTGKMLLRKGNEGQDPPTWYKWVRGFGRKRILRTEYPDTEVHDVVEQGDTLPALGGIKIVHAPGHTPGSICPFLESPSVLFLGDSVLNNIDRLSRPLTWDAKNRSQLDVSLRSLRDLEAETACFGHGPALKTDVMTRIQKLTARPYDVPTWRIVMKNWKTLVRFQESTRRPGNWQGGPR
jgi:glyoxylase-like metal-dependent hydrolase (beta-lactamase superfamily II)